MARNSVGTTVVWALGLVLVSGVAAATWAMLADGGVERTRRHVAPVSTAWTPTPTPDAPASSPDAIDTPAARAAPIRRARRVTPRRRRGRALSATMQAILADPEAKEHVLIEVARIRDSAPGQAILNCLPMHDLRELNELKARSGFDPVNQVERFGFADRVAALQGDFSNVDWSQFKEGFERTERDGVEIYSDGHMRFAVVDDEYMFVGQPDALDEAVDRVINGVTDGAPTITADASGTVPIQALFHMLPTHQRVRMPLNQMLSEMGGNLALAVNVSDDGADVSFTMGEVDPMIREAVIAGLESVKGGGLEESMKDKFAELVEGIEVDRDGDDLKIRAPVTMDFLEGMLGECVHGRTDTDVDAL